MDRSQFMQIRNTVKPLKAQIQVNLMPDFDQEVIEQFARFIHPKCAITSDPGHCTVQVAEGFYVYALYTTGVIQTNMQTGEKIFFTLPANL